MSTEMINTRKYSEKSEREKTANKALLMTFNLFYLVFLASPFSELSKTGSISAAMKVIFGMALLGYVINIASKHLLKDRTELIRYVTLFYFICIYGVCIFSEATPYVRLTIIPVMVASILFFDSKFSKITCSAAFITYASFIFMKCAANMKENSHYIQELVIYGFVFGLLYYVVKTGHAFTQDITGSIQDEQKKQEQILNQVLHISRIATKETDAASEIVDKLEKSTDVVYHAMTEINTTTQSTTENIQEQTEMTKAIQDNIAETVSHTDMVVQLASQSIDTINTSKDVMNSLKNQSQTITNTNEHVMNSMVQLQEKTKEVQAITKMIFEISSQTNMLALNASIESARAGEAGRGFAVVAEQIRELAEQTRRSTENISNILEELDSNAVIASENVQDSIKAAGEQDHLIGNAVHQFDVMSSNVDQLNQNIQSVDRMLKDLSQHNNNIVDSIVQLSAASEQMSANSMEVTERSESTMKEAENAKECLHNVVNALSELENFM